jgi:hypothetical protein
MLNNSLLEPFSSSTAEMKYSCLHSSSASTESFDLEQAHLSFDLRDSYLARKQKLQQ